jgi:hypothetical protein
MLKKAVQQGRSEQRGEEVRTALRAAVRPSNRSWRTEKSFQCSEYPRVLFNVEPLSDARTPLADFFSILLDRLTDLKNRRLIEIEACCRFDRNLPIPVEHPTAVGAGMEILRPFDF